MGLYLFHKAGVIVRAKGQKLYHHFIVFFCTHFAEKNAALFYSEFLAVFAEYENYSIFVSHSS